MGILDHYVAFDLATTGIDAERAEIIRITATRIESGEPTDEFATFVQPESDIAPTIESMTGILAQDVADAPRLSAALADFMAFAGELPLMAHNAPFHVGFLEAGNATLAAGAVYDTLELSRIALPRLRDHKLPTIIAAYGLTAAATQSRSVADVVECLCGTLGARTLGRLQELSALAVDAPPADSDAIGPVVGVLRAVIERKARDGLTQAGAPHVDPASLLSLPNVIGGRGGALGTDRLDPEPVVQAIEPVAVEHVLGPDGQLSRELPNYEVRDTQIDMGRAVTQALNDNELLVCEAGTGTGKSLAYLIPAILWAVRNGRRLVVSTNTKTLQEQLFYKDLPLLERTLGVEFRAALLKGRGNYLCLNRWRSGATPGASVTSERERGVALPVATWLDETTSGDISENTGFSTTGGPGRSLWSRLSAEGQPCSPNACPYYNECYLIKVRRAAQQAHVVVINHSLLFSDLAADHAVLGEFSDLIIDEAHNLERVATDYLGSALSWWEVRDLLSRLYHREAGESGLLARVNREIPNSAIPSDRAKTFQVQTARATDAVGAVTKAAQAFFARLNDTLPRPDKMDRFAHKERFTSENLPFDDALDERDGLCAAVEALGAEVSTLTEWLRELDAGQLPSRDEFVADLDNRLAELAALVTLIVDITEAERQDFVYWYEIPPDEGAHSVRLYAAPLNVGEQLRERFFPDLRSCVMTSATLAVAGKFKYFLDRMGLTDTLAERVRTLAVGSPFDFDKQVRVAVPAWLPSPKQRGFQPAVTDLVRDIILRTRRGTLVLFTSYRQLNDTYRALRDEITSHGILLLAQGQGGSRSNIAETFRNDRGSVLFGTESFWQGVDVPGDALEQLVIVRLPFGVPSEPLVVAQGEQLRAEGRDPFLHMTVPEAAIRFRQGFGRLIRSQSDHGAVLILDTRVVTERFGRAFLGSLPTGHRAYDTKNAMLDDLVEWFETPA